MNARLIVTLGISLLAAPVLASDYYGTSFTSAPGPEWSGTRLPITLSDTGRTYLGPLSQDKVQLTLAGMPAHHKLTVSFQLLLWRNWGGNVTPSVFSLATDTGQTLIRTTFGAALNTQGTYGGQSYPGSYPSTYSGWYKAEKLFGDLIYPAAGDPDYSVNLSYTFDDASSLRTILFSGLELTHGETWGVTKVSVRFDGDKAPAVYRPSTQEWFFRKSDGQTGRQQWGALGDRPVPGDYLGLGSPQITVYRPSTGEWFIRRANGSAAWVQFGGPGDLAMPADYLGVGHIQIAVFRPSTYEFFVRRDDGSAQRLQWGTTGDVPLVMSAPTGF